MKGGERQQRGTFIGLKMQIRGPATPVPRQWGNYLANPKKKVWLELFSSACFISTIGFYFYYRQFKAVAINICCI